MRNFRALVVRAASLAAIALAGAAVFAQLPAQNLLGDSFTGPVSTAPVLSLNTGAPGFPCLTADPTGAPAGSTIANCNLAAPDPPGQGALRFTSTAEQQASAIVSETSLPTAQGLTITFTQHQYGGYGLGGPGNPGGADGISFFLAVAPPSPQILGPQGGALGYASAGSNAGLPGGWLGIGLDAFGNFSNPSFGGGTCAVPPWAGFTPDAITVRGPGHGTEGYCLLSSSADPNASALSASLRGADRASSARTVQIVIDANAGTYTVNIDPAGGTNFELATSGTLPTSYYDPATGQLANGIPPRIAFGFAASTGSATDIHEITSLTATTAAGAVPVFSLTKTNSLTASPNPGDSFEYLIRPRVTAVAPENLPLTVVVTDTLPAGATLTGVPTGASWSCTAPTTSAFSCAYTDPAPIPTATNLPVIHVPVILDLSLAAGTSIVNTATVISDDAAQPIDASNTIVLASAGTPLAVSTTTVADGVVGALYNAPLAATGGAGSNVWTRNSGTLPPGLSVQTAGTITGTPTTTGTFTFSVRVTDSNGDFATRSLSIVVTIPPLTVTTSSVAGGVVGVLYNAPLAATGGVGGNAWSLNGGTLPPGLAVQPAGAITGTPTAAGTFNFSVRVTDSSTVFATRALSIVVTATPLTITTTSLPAAQMPQAYAAQLAATGGTGALRWILVSGALPPGLTLSQTGLIAGTPTTEGLYTFRVRVTDAVGATTTRSLNLRVRPVPLVITTTQLAPGEVAVAYSATLAATGGTGARTWSLYAGSLPAGLTLSPQGVISGIPTISVTRSFTVRVTDSTGRVDRQRLTLTILPELLITTTSLPNGRLVTPYSATLTQSGGVAPFIWTRISGSLPPGLALSTAGAISGTPTALGTFTFTVRLRDALGGVKTRALSITVPRLGKAYIPYAASGSVSSLVVVDLDSGAELTRIPTGQVASVKTSHDGKRCYFVGIVAGVWRLNAINTTTDTVVQTVVIPQSPVWRTLTISPDDSKVFIGGAGAPASGWLRVFNAANLAPLSTFAIGGYAPHTIAISSDNRTVYAAVSDATSNFRMISMSATTGAITATRSLGFFVQPSDLEVIPSGNRIILSIGLNGSASAIIQYNPSLTEVRRTAVSGLPYELAAPNNSYVYAIARSPAVAHEVELATGALRSAPLGTLAQGLALDPSGLNGYTMMSDQVLTRFSLSTFAMTPLLSISPGFAPSPLAIAK